MGANMQRQAVPLLRPQAPIVGTGIERQAARDSGQVVLARGRRRGRRVDGAPDRHRRTTTAMEHDVPAAEVRALEPGHLHQPAAERAARATACTKGEIIADSSSTENGELALGQNMLVAFMPWEGGNFEDAILISERLVREDVFTSIHIEKHEVEARDTKLGPEEITRDIPNVGEDSLRNLDERGIIYVGAEVRPNDILVGKITPKGETELTRRGATAARDLRREGARGEGHLAARAARRARQGDRRQGLRARRPTTSCRRA